MTYSSSITGAVIMLMSETASAQEALSAASLTLEAATAAASPAFLPSDLSDLSDPRETHLCFSNGAVCDEPGYYYNWLACQCFA